MSTLNLNVELESLRAKIERIRALHQPWGIYDECECDHDHEDASNGVVDASDAGLSCAKMYDVYRSCCNVRDDETQSETCASEHNHGPDKPICATIAALEDSE